MRYKSPVLSETKGDFSKTMLRSPNYRNRGNHESKHKIARYKVISKHQTDNQSVIKPKIPGQDRHDNIRFAGFIHKSCQFAKCLLDHRCISLIMANLQADRTKSPYFRCYALQAILNIMAPISNFAVYSYAIISEITRYNLQVDTKDSSCVLSTNSDFYECNLQLVELKSEDKLNKGSVKAVMCKA